MIDKQFSDKEANKFQTSMSFCQFQLAQIAEKLYTIYQQSMDAIIGNFIVIDH